MREIIFRWTAISGIAIAVFLLGKIYLENSRFSLNSDSNLKNFYEPKPNTHITNKPDWLPSDYTYTATINSDSLNERFDYSFDKPQDIFRIITLGESYTYGWSVNTKDNFPEKLEDLLNRELKCQNIKKFEVINLGVGGYDIEYSVHRFKIRGQKYNPDLVLLLIRKNDLYTVRDIVGPKASQYEKQIVIDEASMKKFYSEGRFRPWIKKAIQELEGQIGKQGMLEHQINALQKINHYYKGKLLFVSFSSEDLGLTNESKTMLISFAKDRGNTYFYDGLSPIYDHFADKHPTGKGYAQIAGEVFNYISANRLIPCD